MNKNKSNRNPRTVDIERLRTSCHSIQKGVIHLQYPADMTKFQQQWVVHILMEQIEIHSATILIVEPNPEEWRNAETRALIRKNLSMLESYLEKLIFIITTPFQKIQAQFFTQEFKKNTTIIFVENLEEAKQHLD